MSIEKGVVEKVENDFAWVRAQRKSACNSCASKSHCSSLHGSNYMLVKTSNTLQAKKGEFVSFQINSGTLLKYTFIIYIVPVLGLLLGALSANRLANVIGMNNSVAMVVFTLSGLGMAVWLSRKIIRRNSTSDELIPTIKRIHAKTCKPLPM